MKSKVKNYLILNKKGELLIMDYLDLMGNICSVVGLLISIITLRKVISYNKNVNNGSYTNTENRAVLHVGDNNHHNEQK